MITAAAPASTALLNFCVKAQVPRWISEMLPSVSAGKSSGSQPLVLEFAAAPGGIMTSLVGMTSASTSPLVENSTVMKSTSALSSSSGPPAM